MLIQPERHEDERGYFARLWCEREFAEQGLNTNLTQINVSHNRVQGTLRGMHFQIAPYTEIKIVRCNRGSIFDVVVDVRSDSPTYCRWQGFQLNQSNGDMLYVPEGFAHGFLTLSDDVEVYYQMSTGYSAESARGLRWDDPALGIYWPGEVKVISQRDQDWPRLA
jgi:dTDP-4-dehydrorhamnose 3,5-epimerase